MIFAYISSRSTDLWVWSLSRPKVSSSSLWKLSGPVHPLIFSTWGYDNAGFCGTSIPFGVSLNIYFCFVRCSAMFLKSYMEAFMTPVLGPFMSLTFLFNNGILSFWRIRHGLYLCGTLLPSPWQKTLHEVWRGQLLLPNHPSFTDKWRCPPIYHKIPRNRGKRLCLIFWMIVAFFVLLEGFFGDGVRCFLAHKWAYTSMLSPYACVSARNGKQAFVFLNKSSASFHFVRF